MEIKSLGYINIDDYRLSAMRGVSTPQKDFEEVIKRVQGPRRSDAPARMISASEPIDKTDKLFELCLELETFLVKNLLTGMRNTVQKSGLVDDSYAGKMYEDMLYDEYAKSFAKNAGFGLAEQAYRQLKNYY